MTRREWRMLLGVGVLYAAAVIPIGIHKGGDFTYELGQSERRLHDGDPHRGRAHSGRAAALRSRRAGRALLDWTRLSTEGTTLGRMGMQSLADFTFFFKWPSAWIAVATGLCVCAVLLALRRPARPQDSLSDLGLVTLLAVLVSRVAWLYYHTLAFPAWVAVLSRSAPDPARPEIWRSVLLCVAGMLTSGVLTFGLYPSWLWFIGQANYTWGSLLLLAALVIDRVRRPQPVPSTT